MRLSIPRLSQLLAGGTAVALIGLATFGTAFARGGPPRDWAAHPPHRVRGNATATYQSGYSPSQIRTAYNINNTSNIYGSGQTVAIVDAYDDPTVESDLNTYSSQFGLPACTTTNHCFQKVQMKNRIRTDSGWALEISLDVEMVHAIAPDAHIMLVEAGSSSLTDLFGAVTYAASHGASVVSMSWGGSEFSGESSYDSTFSYPGVAFVASSGDSGTGVEYPAASPNVLAVGGTTLPLDSNGNLTGPETAWNGSGGGQSAYESEPSFQSSFASMPTLLSTGQRVVPDVSFDANPNTGVAVYDSTAYTGQSGWWVVGGTSAGAPSWSGFLALVDQLRASQGEASLTSADPSIYQAATTSYSSDFRDITSGTNGTCGALCTASTGYDAVTGLGSPLGSSLATMLAGGSTPPTNTPTATATAITTSPTPTATATSTSPTATATTTPPSPTATATTTPPSPTATATAGPVSAPTNLSASAVGHHINLTWSASSTPNVTYDVYRGTSANGETLYATGVTSTSGSDHGVTSGTTYYYFVTAVDSAGNQSTPSNEASATAR